MKSSPARRGDCWCRPCGGPGDLGEIRYINSQRLNLGLFQNDINVVWDLAPHDISIMNYLLRSTPTVVSAGTETREISYGSQSVMR